MESQSILMQLSYIWGDRIPYVSNWLHLQGHLTKLFIYQKSPDLHMPGVKM